MDIRSCLIEVAQPTSFKNKSVVLFSGKTYPLLFFSLLLQRITAQRLHTITMLDIEDADQAACKAQLETSFLGSSQWYWVGDLGRLSASSRTAWLEYCKTYRGPHVIFAFVDQVPPAFVKQEAIEQIDLDAFDSKQDVPALITYLFDEKYVVLWTQIRKKIEITSLDAICMLLQYLPLLGTQTDRFVAEWADLLLAPDQSLFTLSTYFFGKKKKQFYTLWRTVHNEYPPQFWIAYWSDQLIKAYGFIVYSEQKNFTEAKKIAYRLPFSFTKTDWQKISPAQLQRAHDFLYQLDFNIKHGTTDKAFDIFYARFFDGSFSSKVSSDKSVRT